MKKNEKVLTVTEKSILYYYSEENQEQKKSFDSILGAKAYILNIADILFEKGLGYLRINGEWVSNIKDWQLLEEQELKELDQLVKKGYTLDEVKYVVTHSIKTTQDYYDHPSSKASIYVFRVVTVSRFLTDKEQEIENENKKKIKLGQKLRREREKIATKEREEKELIKLKKRIAILEKKREK